MWKQSPKQSVYDIRLHIKKPRYQILHGAIGGRRPPPPPPLDPPLELIILELVHLVAYVMSHPARHGTITQKSTGVVDFL